MRGSLTGTATKVLNSSKDDIHAQGKALFNMTDVSEPASKTIVHEIPYLRLFPWLRLFQCPGAAAEPKRLVLGTVGIVLLVNGWRAIDQFFHESKPIGDWIEFDSTRNGAFGNGFFIGPLTEPFRFAFAPFWTLFNHSATFQDQLHAIIAILWMALVWGFFGGAIARIAAIRLTKAEPTSIRDIRRFVLRNALALVATPLIPLGGFLVVLAATALFGLLYTWLGDYGAFLAGIFLFLPLAGGLVSALILIGLGAGWPLLPTSIAVEEQDGFDALSRAYAYVHQRPWHYAFYGIIAILAGAAGLAVLQTVVNLVYESTSLGLRLGGSREQINALFQLTDRKISGAAKDVHSLWIIGIGWLVRGWIHSYFWTAATAIYLLLRGDVDHTPWSRMNNALSNEIMP